MMGMAENQLGEEAKLVAPGYSFLSRVSFLSIPVDTE
jgi:hypothetical protein